MKRSPLRPVSRKRVRDLAQRAHVRQTVLERDRGCRGAAVLPDVTCAGRLEVHELVRRSQDSTAWLDPDKCVALCSEHHRHVTVNPTEGHRVGLVRWSWEQQQLDKETP